MQDETVDPKVELAASLKQGLAALWADGNDQLVDALVMAFDEMEAELTPKATVKTALAQPGWPSIERGEKVIFKDYWCTVVAFTAKGVELTIGEPTAALRKRAGKQQAQMLARDRKILRQQKETKHRRQRKKK